MSSSPLSQLLERVRNQSREAHKQNGHVTQVGNGVSHNAAFEHNKTGSVCPAVVEFTASSCAVLENEGHVRVGVRRSGDMSQEVKIG